MLHSILDWYSAFQLVVSVPTVLGEDIRELPFFNNSVFMKLVVDVRWSEMKHVVHFLNRLTNSKRSANRSLYTKPKLQR